MITKILPEELRKSKIRFDNYVSYYHPIKDIIYINRKYDNTTKEAINKLLGFNPSKKEIVIFLLLHELGHRFGCLYKNHSLLDYRINRTNFFSNPKNQVRTVGQQLRFWNDIDEEKFAMDFAIKYFKEWQKLQTAQTN